MLSKSSNIVYLYCYDGYTICHALQWKENKYCKMQLQHCSCNDAILTLELEINKVILRKVTIHQAGESPTHSSVTNNKLSHFYPLLDCRCFFAIHILQVQLHSYRPWQN